MIYSNELSFTNFKGDACIETKTLWKIDPRLMRALLPQRPRNRGRACLHQKARPKGGRRLPPVQIRPSEKDAAESARAAGIPAGGFCSVREDEVFSSFQNIYLQAALRADLRSRRPRKKICRTLRLSPLCVYRCIRRRRSTNCQDGRRMTVCFRCILKGNKPHKRSASHEQQPAKGQTIYG